MTAVKQTLLTEIFIFDIHLEDFEEKVLQASHDKPVLVDFWADWCAPCLFIDPILKEVVNEYDGQVLLAKLEVDEGKNMKLAGRYQVRGFPTIILFKDGHVVDRFSSARPKQYIQEFIEMHCDVD
ncbi:MAG TPA: thioredoxin [Chromatiales bacterium]|nr:thioredoxin [Thiotrichales bacterium]HIP69179.1 thioredoxin [Chromatiales bacterium]